LKNLNKTKEQMTKDMEVLLHEVSILKDSEKKLKSIEKKLQEQSTAMETAIDGIAILNKEGKYTYLNRAHARIYGYEHPDELFGKSWKQLYYPAEINTFEKEILPIVNETGQWKGESIGKRSDGSIFYQEVSLTLIKGKGLICVVRDITDRKKMEQALKESEKRLHSIIETVPDIIYRLDPQGYITFISDGVKQYGYLPGELVGKNILDFVHPRDRKKALYRINERRTGDRNTKSLEIHLLTRDKITVPFEVISRYIEEEPILLVSAEGLYSSDKPNREHFIGTQGIARDITERKKTEEALETEKERLTVTLRSIGEGVIAINTQGEINLFNEVAEKLTNWKQEEVLGKQLNNIFHIIHETTKERLENPVAHVIKTGESSVLDNHVILIARNGNESYISIKCTAIKDKNKKTIGAVLVFQDISEKRKTENELLKKERLESTGILAGGIAHDFNNFLTGIMGCISLLKGEIQPETPIHKTLLQIEEASLQAQDLTLQLLTLSKGGAPIKKTTSMVDLLKKSTKFALRGSNVMCKFSIPKNLWTAKVDDSQIAQVLNNLIINADQAMKNGGIINIKAENIILNKQNLLRLKEGNFIKISIKDNGSGIPDEYIHKIFDPYFTTKRKGSGLGLATSYSIIKNHDGYLSVESRRGVGTTFFIYLPASRERLKKKFKPKETPLNGKGKILLMDDEELVRDVTTGMLSHMGFDVEIAKEGKEAIKRYYNAKNAGNPFKAVIMDLTIPGGMGGKEAIKELIKIDPDVKVIVSSGYSNDPSMKNPKKFGFKGVINKPYRINELYDIINEALAITND